MQKKCCNCGSTHNNELSDFCSDKCSEKFAEYIESEMAEVSSDQ